MGYPKPNYQDKCAKGKQGMADQRIEATPHTHTRDGPPMVDLMRYTLVGSTRVHRVLIEDLTIGLYQWVNRSKIFYL